LSQSAKASPWNLYVKDALPEETPQACLSQSAGVLDSFSKEAIRRLAYEHLTNEEKKILQNDFIAWARGKGRKKP